MLLFIGVDDVDGGEPPPPSYRDIVQNPPPRSIPLADPFDNNIYATPLDDSKERERERGGGGRERGRERERERERGGGERERGRERERECEWMLSTPHTPVAVNLWLL